MRYKHMHWRWSGVLLSLVLLMVPMGMCAIEQEEKVESKGGLQHAPRNIVNYLTKKVYNINAVYKYGNTALIEASRNGNKKVVNRLIRSGADINAVNNDGYTPLMWTSLWGHKEVVGSLIKAGAHINAVDKYGNTTLIRGSINGHKEIVDNLIKAGANPYIKNYDGENSFDLAGDDEELKNLIIKKRKEYVIKKHKEYLIDGKNRMEGLAASLQKEYDWYKPYWNENKGNHDELEIKRSYSFPKDIAGVIARMRYEISDDEWAQMRRLENEQ